MNTTTARCTAAVNVGNAGIAAADGLVTEASLGCAVGSDLATGHHYSAQSEVDLGLATLMNFRN